MFLKCKEILNSHLFVQQKQGAYKNVGEKFPSLVNNKLLFSSVNTEDRVESWKSRENGNQMVSSCRLNLFCINCLLITWIAAKCCDGENL